MGTSLRVFKNVTIPRMANLTQIISDLRAERDRLDKAIQALSSLDGTAPKASPRRTVSAAARRRMAKAQRARWAAVRPERKPKGKLLHWTQRPENRAKLAKHMRRMQRARLVA